jgi:hypothetical protein
MPTGGQIWYLSNGEKFLTEFAGCEIEGSFALTEDEITLMARISKGDKVVTSYSMVLDTNKNSVNRGASVKELKIESVPVRLRRIP